MDRKFWEKAKYSHSLGTQTYIRISSLYYKYM